MHVTWYFGIGRKSKFALKRFYAFFFLFKKRKNFKFECTVCGVDIETLKKIIKKLKRRNEIYSVSYIRKHYVERQDTLEIWN